VIVVPFKRNHLQEMVMQDFQAKHENYFDEGVYHTLEGNFSFSVLDGEEVVACGGALEVSAGRYIAWSYLSNVAKDKMVSLTRHVRRGLALIPYRRMEMDVACDFPEAHRWAKMLGFEMECERRRAFSPDGKDYALYARIK